MYPSIAVASWCLHYWKLELTLISCDTKQHSLKSKYPHCSSSSRNSLDGGRNFFKKLYWGTIDVQSAVFKVYILKMCWFSNWYSGKSAIIICLLRIQSLSRELKWPINLTWGNHCELCTGRRLHWVVIKTCPYL